MVYLVVVLISLTLLVGFVLLTQYEDHRSQRFFAAERALLDTNIERAKFIVKHVDFAAFARDEIHHAVSRVGHVIAHISLQVVRIAERLLTRAVRHLRIKNESNAAPRENAREFVKTLTDFKDELPAPHSDISDIQ
ncbi:MAG: hypothetical protein WAW90_01295 [Minisyncoccia bacterium]